MKKFLYVLRDIIVLACVLTIINVVVFVVFGFAPINIPESIMLSLVIRGVAALVKNHKRKKA